MRLHRRGQRFTADGLYALEWSRIVDGAVAATNDTAAEFAKLMKRDQRNPANPNLVFVYLLASLDLALRDRLGPTPARAAVRKLAETLHPQAVKIVKVEPADIERAMLLALDVIPFDDALADMAFLNRFLSYAIAILGALLPDPAPDLTELAPRLATILRNDPELSPGEAVRA
jgi:hypothetical protein